VLPGLQIEAKGQQSLIEVRFGPNTASVTLVEPDTLAMGVLGRIQQITQYRRRPFAPLRFGSAEAWPYIQVSSPTNSALLIHAYRVDRPTFWQRTRDDWVIGIVMLFLGGVLGYIVNVIT
jgi:hypothetical protein